jgi:hypothetical protein
MPEGVRALVGATDKAPSSDGPKVRSTRLRGTPRRRLTVLPAVVGVAVLLSACGSSAPSSNGSSPSKPAAHKGASAPKKSAATTGATTPNTADASATSSTSSSSGSGAYELTINYTSQDGWNYSNAQVTLPDYQAEFSEDTNSSPPGQAELQETITNASDPSSPLSDEIETGIGDDNPGRADGPTLDVAVRLAFQLSKGSPDVTAGDCQTTGDESFEGVTSAKQLGYPFNFVLDCQPGSAGQGSDTGTSADMPEGQVLSLLSQLNDQSPIYVLSIGDSDINDGFACIVWFTPPDMITKVSDAMIPSGSNTPANSQCGKTSVSIAS